MTDVYLEQGRTWTFACAVDWPGWARRGKGDEAALEALLACADRYAAVVPGFEPGELHVVGTLPGTGTTDFGAPDARGPWDDEPGDVERQAELLGRCWAAFDRAVAASAPVLRKGPRGGGRDRDAIVAHVQEAERSYGRAYGVRVPRSGPVPRAGRGRCGTPSAGRPGTSSTTLGRSRTSRSARPPARWAGSAPR